MKKQSCLRICLFLLSVWMCVGAFAACGCTQQSGKDTKDTPAETDPAGGIPTPRLRLIDEGKAVFTIVYPSEAPAVVMQSMNRLIDAVREETGVRLGTKSDFLRPGTQEDPEAYELLIGNTNRSATAQVREGLFADQFAIRTVGNRVVIASKDDSYILAAVNYFIAELLKPNLERTADGGPCTLYAADYTLPSSGAENTVSINGKYIYDFSIVYSTDREGYRAVAEQLRNVIADQVGYMLDVRADSKTKESECEILVGKTNRKVSAEMYQKSSPGLMTYEIVVQDTKLQILCGGPYSARECANDMRYSIFGGETMQYYNGSYQKKDLAESVSARAAGTDLRIMTSNILAARWGEDGSDVNASSVPPVEQRAEIYAAVLAKNQPDAIGVQETDQKWLDTLPVYLDILKKDYGLEYTWLFSTMEGKPNMTSILYRSDLLELTASGCEDYSFWQSNKYPYHLRVMAWAKFRVREAPSGEFILLNTHWSWETPEQIAACVQEEISKVNELKAHGVPIFCTGDFNSRQDSEEVLRLMAETGLRENMTVAKENGTLVNYNGGCANVGSPRNSETYIDHVFGYGNYDVLKYETILGNRIAWLSDHSPQFADIRF